MTFFSVLALATHVMVVRMHSFGAWLQQVCIPQLHVIVTHFTYATGYRAIIDQMHKIIWKI